jgi:hypothetical protein
MKHRKIRGGRIKGAGERGAWAELYFMVLAMTYGLKVSSPYGGFGPYDVGVESGIGPVLRVQVKCTLFEYHAGSYGVAIHTRNGARGLRGYLPGTVDFFALYVVPTDDWYIVPYAVVGNRKASLNFKPGVKKQKYEKYREAWHLLLDACGGGTQGPIDIQACGDEGDAAQRRREAMERAAIRKMFRGVLQS